MITNNKRVPTDWHHFFHEWTKYQMVENQNRIFFLGWCCRDRGNHNSFMECFHLLLLLLFKWYTQTLFHHHSSVEEIVSHHLLLLDDIHWNNETSNMSSKEYQQRCACTWIYEIHFHDETKKSNGVKIKIPWAIHIHETPAIRCCKR